MVGLLIMQTNDGKTDRKKQGMTMAIKSGSHPNTPEYRTEPKVTANHPAVLQFLYKKIHISVSHRPQVK
jgi:hypothetical protein